MCGNNFSNLKIPTKIGEKTATQMATVNEVLNQSLNIVRSLELIDNYCEAIPGWFYFWSDRWSQVQPGSHTS